MPYDFDSLTKRTDSIKWHLMQQKHPDLDERAIPLTIADMEWMTAPEIREGLKSYLDETILGYPFVKPAYYEAVQGWMQRRHGFSVEKDWIYPVSGIVPALYAALSALTEPGDGVIIMPPVYFPFFSAIAATGRREASCPLINEDEHYKIDFDRFEALAADPQNTMFILCSPHNPGGIVWSKETLCRLDDICRRHRVTVLADEIHHDLILPGHHHIVFQTLSPETAMNTVTCTAPSKTFNLAGLGLANLIMANPEHLKKYDDYEEKTGFPHVNLLAFKACELAYTHGDAWLDEAIHQIDQNRQTAEVFLKQYFPEIKIAPLQGTYLLWIDVRELEPAQTSRFIAQDGAMFGPGGEGHLRLNLALPNRALKEQLQRFAEDYNRI